VVTSLLHHAVEGPIADDRTSVLSSILLLLVGASVVWGWGCGVGVSGGGARTQPAAGRVSQRGGSGTLQTRSSSQTVWRVVSWVGFLLDVISGDEN
jgi:hypothetical protein